MTVEVRSRLNATGDTRWCFELVEPTQGGGKIIVRRSDYRFGDADRARKAGERAAATWHF
jgi:hypothetical protein